MKIVYVHLGRRNPKYVSLSILRTLKMFPQFETLLIHDEDLTLDLTDLKYFSNFKTHLYVSQNNLEEYKKKININFREGFWWYTYERLLALTNYFNIFPNEPIIHVESDVILFPNFPLNQISKINNKILWCRYNNKADVASILYIPNKILSEFLSINLIRIANESKKFKSEMEILSQISIEHRNKFGIFPIQKSENLILLNESNHGAKHDGQIKEFENYFEGIFDSAAIGMWLAGQDPMNNFGYSMIHDDRFIVNGDSYVDPRKADYLIDNDGCMQIIQNNVVIPLYNLHIHSKFTEMFDSKWQIALHKLTAKSYDKTKYRKFSLGILFFVIIDSYKNKNLIRLLSSIPGISKLTKVKFLRNTFKKLTNLKEK